MLKVLKSGSLALTPPRTTDGNQPLNLLLILRGSEGIVQSGGNSV